MNVLHRACHTPLCLLFLSVCPCNLFASFVFWTESGSVYRSNLDGAARQQLFAASAGIGNASSLAIDYMSNQLYWWGRLNPANLNGNGVVARMNFDGSGLTYVINGNPTVGTITYGFDIDSINGTMYMMDGFQMKRANLDGTGLTSLPHSPAYTSEIQVNSTSGRAYYNGTEAGHEGIRSIDLNGNGLQALYTGATTDFSLDFVNNTIYLASGYSPYTNMEIKRVRFDGTGMQTLVSGIAFAGHVETDIVGGKVYWMTPTAIQRANLDGSMVENIQAIASTTRLAKDDMILYLGDAATVPEPSSAVVLGLLTAGAAVFAAYRRRKLA